ncbi:phosphatase PAP2 family protein [Peptoniphilus stercorisuis]|uniref:Undecaprenyl-diphosphatase n=1 Tax=Peptoniphilus stercorisuis TaxID=1436965 RepID=A0ABS4K9S1_9FIRM|nr:phosphatase PAP2 family protein [Peptoniphilus stercorisuis]MBP2024522.1 undecaprenyl-diphosphatase [Peptoniphilus stercorisuis]
MEINILNEIAKIHNPFLDKIMSIMSALGSGGIVFIIISVIFLLNKKTRKLGLTISLSLMLCAIIGNGILKPYFSRIRPYIEHSVPIIVNPPSGYSFPSGHTYSAFAAATAVYLNNKKWGVVFFIFAFIMGFSRMYLYVHYPTDVLAGIVLGIIIGIISNKIIEKTVKV